MTALDAFETLEFGADLVGPAQFPVDLFKSSRGAFSFTATGDGSARRNTGTECVLVPFYFQRGGELERRAAEAVLKMAAEYSWRQWTYRRADVVAGARQVTVNCRVFTLLPDKAHAYRCVQGDRSGLVIMDGGYVW